MTYYESKARDADRSRLPARANRDAQLREHIERVWEENFRVYGVRKVWRQLRREGVTLARCTVARLMRELGLRGVVRGRRVKTTPVATLACPADRVNRVFQAPRPNALWLADLTYVATWTRSSTSRSSSTLVPGASWAGRCRLRFAPTWHSTRLNRPCTPATTRWSTMATEGRKSVHPLHRASGETGIEQSVGSVGDSYNNAMAESIIGRTKTEVIRRRGPWQALEAVEFATLEWVDWFNYRRVLEPIGDRFPAEAEAAYYRQTEHTALAA